jgi:putative inorganic carbon (hco3(-)) transporter
VVIYTTANALALFLGPLIAVAAAILLYERDRYARAGAAVFLVVAAPAMLLTFSRGGFLAMAAVAVGLALSHRRRWWLLAGVVVAGVLVAAIPPVFQRISLEFRNVEGSTFTGRDGRLELWKAALQMLRANPIFGAGLSGYAEKVGPYWNKEHGDALFIDPHNIVLNFWTETGLLGLFSFAWIMFEGFRTALRGWREALESWRPIELGVFLALVAIAVHGLVDVPYFKNDLSLEFWVLIALAVQGVLSTTAARDAGEKAVPIGPAPA